MRIKKNMKMKEERSSAEKEKNDRSANLQSYVSLPTSLTSLAVAFLHVSVSCNKHSVHAQTNRP